MEANSPDESKQFLHTFLSKQGIAPEYKVRPTGAKQRQRFLCELLVQGFPYRGAGNSTNKKDAQTNAAKDFIQYLVRTGSLNEAEIPEGVLGYRAPIPVPSLPRPLPNRFSPQKVFESGFGPDTPGPAYRPFHDASDEQLNARNVTEAEDVDVNSSLHGNWTIENAKGRLHQYLQMNKIKADYKFLPIGPAHARSFQAEMSFYVKELGRPIHARETGSTQKTASKSCALSLVRQLYHLRVIEHFSGTLRRPKESESVKPFPVRIDPQLMAEVQDVINEFNLPVATVMHPEEVRLGQDSENPDDGPVVINLVCGQKKETPLVARNEATSFPGIISWSPPLPNWNPWTSCNIDEGHMASTPLDQLSEEFMESFKEIQQSNKQVQELYNVRSELPIFSEKSRIMEAVSEYSVILIKGDTGSGKTTQICQFILDDYILSGQGAYCNIVVTQPRRISAISVAERVAAERGEELGMTVGYSVRFESCLPRPYASVMFCTVGVLLRKLEAGLRGVSHVIVDEIHERDVNSDFLLIVLRDMLSSYPDLRVILMSATIDATLFTDYFNSCPVIHVEGRAFPVHTQFLEDIVETLHFTPSPASIRKNKKRAPEENEAEAEVKTCDSNLNVVPVGSHYSQETKHTLQLLGEREINLELIAEIFQYIRTLSIPGAILVFLPGWNVIFAAMRYFQQHPVFGSKSYVIIPLHSQLPREDQHRVFDKVPAGITKIILSTNIAETSLTIDDVVYVIDSCKAKTKLFTSHNNMTTFVEMWASKSNLIQRRGRAGRVRPGYCFHLCTKSRFDALEENMTPEMFRTPLHEIALTIKLLGLGGISQFLSKAPEPPPLDAVIEAEALLYELNCLNVESELTSLGIVLSKMPLDPRLGKMIILAIIFGCGDAIATISAYSANMSEVFTFGPDNKRLAPQQRSFGANRHSDHFSMLNACQQWNGVKNRQGEDASYDFCQERLLSLPCLKMTTDAKNQLLQVASSCGVPDEQLMPLHLNFRTNNPTLDIIAGLLCTGFYPNILIHLNKRKVLTTEAKVALIHKASINCSRFDVSFPYPFFVYGEKIRTRVISCKQLTMVTPIHILLFGSRKVEFQDFVRLDNWIKLEMDPLEAAAIVALRPAIEDMILQLTENPEGFFPMAPHHERLVDVIKRLSRLEAANFGVEEHDAGGSSGHFRDASMPSNRVGSEIDLEFSANSEDSAVSRGVKRSFEDADFGETESKYNPEAAALPFSGNGSGYQGGTQRWLNPIFASTRARAMYRVEGSRYAAPRTRFSPRPRPMGFGAAGGGFRGEFHGVGDRGGPHRFFSTNRGGWSARGGIRRGFHSSPRGGFSRPRGYNNYPY